MKNINFRVKHYWKELLIASHLHNIAHKNLILEIGYTIRVFCKSTAFCQVHFTSFFPKIKQPQNLLHLFFSGKLKFPGASRHLISVARRASW